MNILITTSSFGEQDPDILKELQSIGLQVILNPYRRKLSEDEVSHLMEDFRPVGIIAGVEPLTRAVLEKANCLKVISRCGIGLDSVDLVAARELGVSVTNTPDAPTIPVAELTMGLVLTLLRSIHVSDAAIRSGVWQRPMGTLLHGKTFGIIGCGRIGSYVAKIASSFGCRVVGCDPYCGHHHHIDLMSLDNLLETSDIISLHLPWAQESHHLIDSARITQMKQGAILVNASRGGLVDEAALAEALQDGKLSGAALDCFEKEPYDGPLAGLNNTLLTGHIGSYASEARSIMERQAAENLVNALHDLHQLAGSDIGWRR